MPNRKQRRNGKANEAKEARSVCRERAQSRFVVRRLQMQNGVNLAIECAKSRNRSETNHFISYCFPNTSVFLFLFLFFVFVFVFFIGRFHSFVRFHSLSLVTLLAATIDTDTFISIWSIRMLLQPETPFSLFVSFLFQQQIDYPFVFSNGCRFHKL